MVLLKQISISEMIETVSLKDYGVQITVIEKEFIDGVSYFVFIYDNIEYTYNSKHLNINTIVNDMMNLLSNESIMSFKMKVQGEDILRSKVFDIFYDKFNHCSWSLGSTWFSPTKNEYELEVIMQGKKLNYKFIGDIKSVNSNMIVSYYLNNYPEYTF